MILHLDIILLLNISCIFVFVVHNPISAALWLIVTFICSSFLLWFINSEFFALIYIIIYVGAVAVLFLFVIMMLDIKSIDYYNFYNFYGVSWNLKITTLILYFFPTFFFSYFFSLIFSFNNSINDYFYLDFLDNINSLHSIGISLYNSYLICVLIAGLSLLVAIIGAIILTLNFNSPIIFKKPALQLSRSDNVVTFIK